MFPFEKLQHYYKLKQRFDSGLFTIPTLLIIGYGCGTIADESIRLHNVLYKSFKKVYSLNITDMNHR